MNANTQGAPAPELRPGQRALIVRCRTHPQSVGMLVEVVCKAPKGDFAIGGIQFELDQDDFWAVESLGSQFTYSDGDRSPINCFARPCLSPIEDQGLETDDVGLSTPLVEAAL